MEELEETVLAVQDMAPALQLGPNSLENPGDHHSSISFHQTTLLPPINSKMPSNS